MEFVNAVSAGGSVKFLHFHSFFVFFLLKLLKLGEIDGVKFLAWKSGGVKFWTNSMSGTTWNWDFPILSLVIAILPEDVC